MTLCAHFEIETLDFAMVFEQAVDLASLGRVERDPDAVAHEYTVRECKRPAQFHDGQEL